MRNNRLAKFERVLKYQSNRVDLIKQQLLVQRSVLSQLHRVHQELVQTLDSIQNENAHANQSVTLHQQCGLAMLEAHKKIKAKRIEIATADEKLDYLLHTLHEADCRLKAWEKLVDRETTRDRETILSLELQHADELYLLSKFAGEKR